VSIQKFGGSSSKSGYGKMRDLRAFRAGVQLSRLCMDFDAPVHTNIVDTGLKSFSTFPDFLNSIFRKKNFQHFSILKLNIFQKTHTLQTRGRGRGRGSARTQKKTNISCGTGWVKSRQRQRDGRGRGR
ncbi:Hypothetical predicted protein, partial [Drosophila guanche]